MYGNVEGYLGSSRYKKSIANDSFRWRDLEGGGSCDKRNEDLFHEKIRYRLGEGKNIAFWKVKWIGNGTLAQKFQLLFELEENKEGMVSSFRCWEKGVSKWYPIYTDEIDIDGKAESEA